MDNRRAPPALVPTLTDVVAPVVLPQRTAPAPNPTLPLDPTPPAAAGAAVPAPDVDEALIDALVDRTVARLMPLLQQRLHTAWVQWLQQLQHQAPPLPPTLTNDLADIVRDEVLRHLAGR
ncbi:hypothetical protein [Tepidimonas aquatica]|jgi:hypothetical protein|uniref:Uncharacterized protein n=1 Tax=Tepidimonas aquatica TaxID=247482 RepID=A0A554WU04_9BURK|nr:hypothetical protein [Tepidimonas aquatica]TSE27068.1 hypothetical protein Taqua_00379 [Tepidimonas aquatica]